MEQNVDGFRLNEYNFSCVIQYGGVINVTGIFDCKRGF